MTNQQKPTHEIRFGAVKAAIFESDGRKGPFHSITFSRLYKAEGTWKRSHSFSGRELPDLAKALTEASTWVLEHEVKE